MDLAFSVTYFGPLNDMHHISFYQDLACASRKPSLYSLSPLHLTFSLRKEVVPREVTGDVGLWARRIGEDEGRVIHGLFLFLDIYPSINFVT